jgi:prepilin-type N-terminal cleavage/methylation domain-containing protein
MRGRLFTLIELLVVVAIIAILASLRFALGFRLPAHQAAGLPPSPPSSAPRNG